MQMADAVCDSESDSLSPARGRSAITVVQLSVGEVVVG
jgi:hypothetical protein